MKQYTNMELSEVDIATHNHLIALAKDGNTWAATVLMGDAAIYIQHGVPLPEPLGSYIGEALYRASLAGMPHGVDINKAFHLDRKPGGQKYDGILYTHLICMEVQLARFTTGRMAGSRVGAGAYDIVADKYGITPESIRKKFSKRDAHWDIDNQTEAKLRAGIKSHRRLILQDE